MTEEKHTLGEGASYPLPALLTLPDNTSAPCPAVVFVHGSGSSNMDEKVGKLTPFKDLAQGLAQHGIASLRYDKRSFVHGWKMVRDKTHPITVKEETVEDAILAAQLLRQDPRIDPTRVFLVGHSMGGMLAPRIDTEGGNFTGLILLAGSPRLLEEILLEQTEEMLSGIPKILRPIGQKQLQKLQRTFEGLYELSDEEAKKRKFGGGTTLYYFKEMGEHPAPAYLQDLQKPLLILQGAKDFQAKADRDFAAYRELLQGRSNVSFKLYENLNHAFVPAICESISNAKREYAVPRHIGADVIADIAEWILQNG